MCLTTLIHPRGPAPSELQSACSRCCPRSAKQTIQRCQLGLVATHHTPPFDTKRTVAAVPDDVISHENSGSSLPTIIKHAMVPCAVWRNCALCVIVLVKNSRCRLNRTFWAPDAKPKFCPARFSPRAKRPKVHSHLFTFIPSCVFLHVVFVFFCRQISSCRFHHVRLNKALHCCSATAADCSDCRYKTPREQ